MSARKKPKPPKARTSAPRPSRRGRFVWMDRSEVEVLHEGDAVDTIEIVGPAPARPKRPARKG